MCGLGISLHIIIINIIIIIYLKDKYTGYFAIHPDNVHTHLWKTYAHLDIYVK